MNMTERQVPERSLFVVGDDAQSIYGFRGSKIEIILSFEKEYPGAKEVILNQNYRSTQPILDLAERVLTHNPGQKKKDLFTKNPEDVHVAHYLARNDRDEAEYIIRQLHDQYAKKDEVETESEVEDFDAEGHFDNELSVEEEPTYSNPTQSNDPISSMFDVYLESDDFSFSSPSTMTYSPKSWEVPTTNWTGIKNLNDCAILYRTHSQSRSLEETFLKYNLPYRLVSGVKFLDRKEIKDVLAVLKFLANGEDKVSLGRFLPLVTAGVGVKTMQKIIAYLEDADYPLAPKYSQMVLELFQKMQQVWLDHTNLIEMTKDLLDRIGYFRYLKEQYPVKEEYDTKVENIGELYSLMYEFDKVEDMDLSEKLKQFLAQVSLMTGQDMGEEDNRPKINLMSLHQSKGLEFETVFLVGVEDGILPHVNSLYEPNGLEEEVRLAYVGVTRAKKYLHLVSADSRVTFGQVQTNPVSRIFRPFLDSHCKRKGRS